MTQELATKPELLSLPNEPGVWLRKNCFDQWQAEVIVEHRGTLGSFLAQRGCGGLLFPQERVNGWYFLSPLTEPPTEEVQL